LDNQGASGSANRLQIQTNGANSFSIASIEISHDALDNLAKADEEAFLTFVKTAFTTSLTGHHTISVSGDLP